MRNLSNCVLLILFSLVSSPALRPAGPFPRLLPPSDQFRLTLREERRSKIARGPECAGEASLAFVCHVFSLTLKNNSKFTVLIIEDCYGPRIRFESKKSSPSVYWQSIGYEKDTASCDGRGMVDVRLKPGQKTESATRLVSESRGIYDDSYTGPGSYTLRASWTLWGCTEGADKRECLGTMQIVGPYNLPDVNAQEPVTIMSNELTVKSPPLPDLGSPKFGFQVSLADEETNAQTNAPTVCAGVPNTRAADCAVFEYRILNIGPRAVINWTASCSDTSITPEYRLNGGDWKRVPEVPFACAGNIAIGTPMLPGWPVNGTFRIGTLAPRYDTTALRGIGHYDFRFTFWPDACVASSDGSFCLQLPEKRTAVVSNIVSLQVHEPNASN